MYINCTLHFNVFYCLQFFQMFPTMRDTHTHTPYGFCSLFFRSWTGYLSPSAGLKFADVPNGLAAISKARPRLLCFERVSGQLESTDQSGATRWMDSDLALHGLVRSLSWSRWGLGGHGNGNHVMFRKSAAKGVLSKELVPYMMIFE